MDAGVVGLWWVSHSVCNCLGVSLQYANCTVLDHCIVPSVYCTVLDYAVTAYRLVSNCTSPPSLQLRDAAHPVRAPVGAAVLRPAPALRDQTPAAAAGPPAAAHTAGTLAGTRQSLPARGKSPTAETLAGTRQSLPARG